MKELIIDITISFVDPELIEIIQLTLTFKWTTKKNVFLVCLSKELYIDLLPVT